jgi:hypothetical protein
MRPHSVSRSRSQPAPPLPDHGICQLPFDVPCDKTLKAGVESGDPEALYVQAVYHYKGINAPLDWNLAHSLMKRSADQGYPPALYSYAHFAHAGIGMPMSYKRAQDYYLQASERGIPAATSALVAMQNDTVWLERYGRRRRVTSRVEYQHPRRQPDVTFGSPIHSKRIPGQYSPLSLPRSLQKTNPLRI